MIRRLFIAFGVLALIVSPGCGNKGPLTLPDKAADDTQAASGKTEK